MLRKKLFVALDANKARLFISNQNENSGAESLMQKEILQNIELKRLENAEKNDSRSSARAVRSSFSDNENAEYDDVLRSFAKEAYRAALQMALKHDLKTIVLMAGPKMIGFLRAAKNQESPGQIQIKEIPKDFSHHDAEQIYAAVCQQFIPLKSDVINSQSV